MKYSSSTTSTLAFSSSRMVIDSAVHGLRQAWQAA
jgi:hypothetical protein